MCSSEAALYSFRSQCDLPVPETPKDALINETKHTANLFVMVWTKMETFLEYGEKDDVSVMPHIERIGKYLVHNVDLDLKSSLTFVSSSSNSGSKH